jgi:hypothetical protein
VIGLLRARVTPGGLRNSTKNASHSDPTKPRTLVLALPVIRIQNCILCVLTLAKTGT